MDEKRNVEEFHKRDDLDSSDRAHHHTNGRGLGQSSPGPHRHRGDDGSNPLLDDVAFTGAVGTYNATTMRQVIAALVKLGASDGTT